MNHAQDPKDTLAALRELPPEVSLQQVEHMVAAFPLAMGAVAWLVHTLKFNLNTLVMTGSATLLIVTSMFLFSGGASSKISDLHDAGKLERTVEPEIAREELPAVVLDTPPTKPQSTPATAPPVASDTTPPHPALPPPIQAVAPLLPAPAPPDPATALGIETRATSSPPATGKERRFDLRGFNEIHLLSSVNATVEIGEFSVTATGREDLLELLDIRVQGNALRISFPDGRHRYKGENDVHCVVRLPVVKTLHIAGSGGITASTLPNTNSLDLVVSGSGHLKVGSVEHVQELDLLLKGSGGINIAGLAQVDQLRMNLLGSGDIVLGKAERVGSTKALLKGSGGIRATQMDVQGTCALEIKGSGNVTIAGSTNMLQVLLVGSGNAYLKDLTVAHGGAVDLLGTGNVFIAPCPPMVLTTKGSGTIHTTGSAGRKGSRGPDSGGQ